MLGALTDLWNLKCKSPQSKKLKKFNKTSIFLLYNECNLSTGVFFMAFQTVFKRYELKYMLTLEQRLRILETMKWLQVQSIPICTR